MHFTGKPLRDLLATRCGKCDFFGETLLIVNTAARCGLTPQYEGLVNLENEYGPQGLKIRVFVQ